MSISTVFSYDYGSGSEPNNALGSAHLLEYIMFGSHNDVGIYNLQRESLTGAVVLR
jgi:hypothetical protein